MKNAVSGLALIIDLKLTIIFYLLYQGKWIDWTDGKRFYF